MVVARHVAIDAGFGADCKATDVARVVALELGELRLVLAHPALAAGECLSAPALLVGDDVLNHFESLRPFHGLRLLRYPDGICVPREPGGKLRAAHEKSVRLAIDISYFPAALSASTSRNAVRLAAKSTRSWISCCRNFCMR